MKKFRKWRIIYWVCCFVYLGWIINLGTNEYDRINSQYRRIANQLDAGRIRTTALEELGTEWFRKSMVRPGLKEDACFSWPPAMVEAREKKIEERLGKAKKQAAIKLVLFYMIFVILFLLAPPLLIYLLIVGVIRVFSSIKFVK
jgi:hypothetical protein